MPPYTQPLPASLTLLLAERPVSLLARLLRLIPSATRPQQLPRHLHADLGISLPPADPESSPWYR